MAAMATMQGMLTFFFAFWSITAFLASAQFESIPSPSRSPANSSFLPPRPPFEDTERSQIFLELMWDGMVAARDALTKELRWSFDSGNPLSSANGPVLDALEGINSSFGIGGEAPISEEEFIFCSTDWKLYSFDKKYGIQALPFSPHELIRNTPTISDGAVILGTMMTSVFAVDVKSGTLLQTFDSRNKSMPADSVGQEDIFRFLDEVVNKIPTIAEYLFILRRDYSIKSVTLDKGVLLWNVSVADVALHFINSNGLHLPGPGGKMLRDVFVLPASSELNALPGRYERIDTFFPDVEQGSASGFTRITIIVIICVALIVIIASPFVWMRLKPKQTVKKRKPRKARAGTMSRSQELRPVTEDVLKLKRVLSDSLVSANETVSDDIILGKLRVRTSDNIGFGSNGTIVFDGFLEERPVAVKRMLAQFYDKAQKEINTLIKSDIHPNIIRYYHVESDLNFVYVALERCRFSLNDLVVAQSSKHHQSNSNGNTAEDISKEELESHINKVGSSEDYQLWDADGQPSYKLLQLMRDILAGLAHLHEIGIVHRDLKPHNVLISNGRLQAKLSDMGISKQLADGVTIIESHSSGLGSSGWQAPEQLKRGLPQTKSMDLFSFGCILFFSITGGYHPFGARFERDHNILNGKFDLFRIMDIPEATSLLANLLQSDPCKRPLIKEVLVHPLFWSSEKRLKFLCDASDCVEVGDKESVSLIVEDLNVASQTALGCSWSDKLDALLLQNLGKYRKYNFNSVKDLLRVIRNKSSHFRELPQDVQQLFGSHPEGFENYFRKRFPRLLIDVFIIIHRHCANEDGFRKYFSPDTVMP